MKDEKIKRLVQCAMLAALTCAATAFISFPVGVIPGAYVHAGDSVIYVAAYLLGPAAGAAAAAVGSACADLMLGAHLYALPTFVIKGILGYAAGWALRRRTHGKKSLWRLLLLSLCGLIVVFGYGLYETVLYGFQTALASAPFNCVQILASALLGVPAIAATEKGFAAAHGRA